MFGISCVIALIFHLACLGSSSDPPGERPQSLSKPLLQAVRADRRNTVRALLRRGTDPNMRDGKGTPVLVLAAGDPKADKAIVRALLAAGASVNARDADGETVLMLAAWWRHPATVKALLAAGANVHAKNNSGWTPLHDAGDFETARL